MEQERRTITEKLRVAQGKIDHYKRGYYHTNHELTKLQTSIASSKHAEQSLLATREGEIVEMRRQHRVELEVAEQRHSKELEEATTTMRSSSDQTSTLLEQQRIIEAELRTKVSALEQQENDLDAMREAHDALLEAQREKQPSVAIGPWRGAGSTDLMHASFGASIDSNRMVFVIKPPDNAKESDAHVAMKQMHQALKDDIAGLARAAIGRRRMLNVGTEFFAQVAV